MHIKLWLEMPSEMLMEFIHLQEDMDRWNTCKNFAAIGTLLLREDGGVGGWRRIFIHQTVQDACSQRMLEEDIGKLVGDFEKMATLST